MQKSLLDNRVSHRPCFHIEELNLKKGSKPQMQRFLALLIMLVPGFLAAYGIKLMRDMAFGYIHPLIPYLWLQFIIGLLLFISGLLFIAGFIFRRDRKQNKVQKRFQRKE
jgi:hypothetical protein